VERGIYTSYHSLHSINKHRKAVAGERGIYTSLARLLKPATIAQNRRFCTKRTYLTTSLCILYNLPMKRHAHDQILKMARKGVLRPKDLDAHRLPRRHLAELVAEGQLLRTGRGLYMLPDHAATENHSLAVIAKRVPDAALRFHGLTTQLPAEVWIALGPNHRTPRVSEQTLHVSRFTGDALTKGIEEHAVEGVTVRVYNPAKTIADCFKFRNHIGIDVAVEALRDAWRQKRVTADDLWKYAKICRVQNVMRPYLEALA